LRSASRPNNAIIVIVLTQAKFMNANLTNSPDSRPMIDGYTVTEQLYSGSGTAVYRAIQETRQRSVVIKVLQREYPSFGELVQFRNQYLITKRLTIPGIAKPLALEPFGNGYALVMEDTGSLSLSQYLENQSLSLLDILEIAIQLTSILQQLHQQRIIHKDIKPANILIAPNSKHITLIDFSIASLLPKETQTIQSPQGLEGTLAYLAPEQTGRMNRGIDYRTDFYALGVTLYQLLTGELPFPGDDPLEVIHSHIAKTITPVHEVNPESPAMLGAIVAKLMAKNAEDRYQSALGLKYDLEQCLSQWQETGEISDFELGKRDLSDRFLIPEKLYGRETEVAQLLTAFDQVAEGTSELMLVAGFSGIGKTAVINEVHKPIVRQRGYFIKGKFDQLNRNIPFSAFIQAFSDLVGQLLSESDQQLQRWKADLLAALGDNGQVLIDLIPELEQIIGPQPPASELSGEAAQNRFNRLFQNFIQVFTKVEHPLVIFIDDLQWADSASLGLMQSLLTEAQCQYLLVLGAYRDNEVFPGHPFLMTIKALENAEVTLDTLSLGPLDADSLNHLIADAFQASENIVQPLSDLIMQKTQGNPFFATQFLKALHQDGLITFNREGGHWECDLVRVQDAALTDDVVDFMALQLQKLPLATQEQLKLAACIGARFDLKTLTIVSEKNEIQVASDLWPALQQGLIVPKSKIYKFYLDDEQSQEHKSLSEDISEQIDYRFFHDRVQQAAYSLIPDDQKWETHWEIGKLILHKLSASEREAKLFEIVNQLNIGIRSVEEPIEREEIARLNLAAADKAKASTAYSAAFDYLQTCFALLTRDCWRRQYDLTLTATSAAAEVAYLQGDFATMQQQIDAVLQHATTLLDQVGVYETKIQAHIVQNQFLEAVNTALHILRLLGLEFTDDPSSNDTQQKLTETANLLSAQAISSPTHLPEMTSATGLATTRILVKVISATYIAKPSLLPLIICEGINLFLRQGNNSLSAFVYAWYGVILCTAVGDISLGYEMGEVALELLNKFDAREIKARTEFTVYYAIQHWKIHIFETVHPFSRSYQIGLENGDLEYASWSAFCYCYHSYIVGCELTELHRTMGVYREAIAKARQEAAFNYLSIFHQSVQNLLSKSQDWSVLEGEAYSEAQTLPVQLAANDGTGLNFLYISKLILAYLFEQFEQAIAIAKTAENYIHTGAAYIPVFHFYDSLIQLAVVSDYRDERQQQLERVNLNQLKLGTWADHAPMNYQHKFDLVEAERHRVLGNRAEAIELYDRAISGAKTNSYTQEEALAHELAARFYLDWGKEKVAAGYMQDAYYCYSRWGAKAKVANLEQRYPQLLQPILQPVVHSFDVLNTVSTISRATVMSQTGISQASGSDINQTLDLASVIKASQALSGTLQLDELLSQLTQIILRNSGGDRCVLIIPNDSGAWQVRAITTPDTVHLCTEAIEESPDLALKLIQYVKNTQNVVIIDNLVTDLPVLDQYLQTQQPKSVLGLPILTQGRCLGILYLHNQLSAGVFTPERMAVLSFLCTQAAISLENAQLYEQVQQSLTHLQHAQLQLVQSEKMSALGGLVSGVAHEINNPVGCILGNVGATEDYFNDLLGLLDLYGEAFPEPGEEIEAELEAVELDYVRQDLSQLIRAMRDSGDRIKSISESLRTFSRKDTDSKQSFNLHEGLDSTLLILRHRLKANEHRPEIEVIKNYGSLQPVDCFPGQLNQVFMNILANAIDVFDDFAQQSSFAALKAQKQQITIETRFVDNGVTIKIADNGSGIPEEIQDQIFDNLFTTKAVGKGTGLGLAIARQIVVDVHGGQLEVNSQLGQGTEFLISLP